MVMQPFGDKLRYLRQQKGLSINKLAEGTCSPSYLSKVERGVYPTPSAKILQSLADKLDVPLKELLRDFDGADLENEMLLDISQILVHRGEYAYAFEMIKELLHREDLLDYQKEPAMLCLAECLIRTEQSDEAIQILTNLQYNLESKQSNNYYIFASIFNLLGTAFYLKNDLINAYSFYSQAYHNGTNIDDLLLAKICYNLGTTCQSLRIDSQAKVYLDNATRIYENLGDRRRLADSLYRLGISLKNLEQIERAGEYIKNALALYEAENISRYAQLAKAQFAFYILSTKDHAQALAQLYETLDEYKLSGDTLYFVYTSARIAQLHLDAKEVTKAETLLESVVPLIETDKDDPHYAYFYRVYARLLADINRYDESLQNSFKSSEIFGKMGLRKEQATSLEQAVYTFQQAGRIGDALNLSIQVIEILNHALDFLVVT